MDFRLVLSILANSRRFSILFVLNFSLGIVGIFALEQFKGAMNYSLEENAREFLGADLVISSRFPITEATVDQALGLLPATAATLRGVSLSSMASGGERSRLVQVVNVAPGFPFYGSLEFGDGRSYPSATMPLPASHEVWLYPEIMAQLGVTAGTNIEIGAETFSVAGVVVKDSYKAIRFSGYLPRIYMTAAGIERAGLLVYGSTARHSVSIKFTERFSNNRLEVLENELEAVLGESVRVRSPKDGSDRVAQVTRLIADFLSIVSLVAFFLALVGVIYLYSGFLLRFKSDREVLHAIGMRRTSISATYLAHFLLLVVMSAIVVLALSYAVQPMLRVLLAGQERMVAGFRFDPWFFGKALAFVFLIGPAIALPMLAGSGDRRAGRLWSALARSLPLLFVAAVVSAQVSGEPRVGLAFFIAVLAFSVAGWILAALVLRAIESYGLPGKVSAGLAAKRITRQSAYSIPVWLALTISTGLFSLIPQVGASLDSTLQVAADGRPRLFLVDIQRRQLESLLEFLAARKASLGNVSPLVRGRIVGYNGEDFSNGPKMGVDEPDTVDSNELRNRSVNVTYRQTLYDTEEIVEGREFSGSYRSADYSEDVELSIESRYAERLGVGIGDELVFDIFGTRISAIVANIRTVRWADFLPNFFLVFQDGAINDAPATYLATVPDGTFDVDKLISDIAQVFPGITVVDVKYVIDSIVELTTQVTAILYRAGLVCGLIGLLIVGVIIWHQLSARRADMLRLKFVGVRLMQIRRSFLLEYFWLSLSAGITGALLGAFGSWALSVLVFDQKWQPAWPVVTATAALVPGVVCAFVAVFSRRVLVKQNASLFDE